jgi:cytochrome c553
MKRLTIILAAALVVLLSPPLRAQEDSLCPLSPATPWRAVLKEETLKKSVRTMHDGNWSSYIAHWERQIDTAQDVKSRKKALVVKFGKNRTSLKGRSLDRYIKGMKQRVETSYCLAEESATVNLVARIEQLDKDELVRYQDSGKRIAEMVGCPKCHGRDVIEKSPGVPFIDGQHFGYLANQMRAFGGDHVVSTGSFGSTLRNDSAMKQWSKLLTPDNRLRAAAYYSSLQCHSELKKDAADVSKPESLPVCLSCHGTANGGKNIGQVVPSLNGQKKNYLLTQMRAFRMTKGDPRSFRFRNRRFHQFMSAIAGQLTNEEMDRLATWFSSRSCKSGAAKN